MKVLVLAPALRDTSPGQRYRIEQWARHLQPAGWHFTFLPFETEALHRVLYERGRYGLKAGLILQSFFRRFHVLAMANAFDVVLIYREAALVGPAVIERILAGRRVPIVYDFDDAIWIPNASPANDRFGFLKCFGKAADICRLSTQVIVGNGHLASYARRFNANVSVIPSTIDTESYVPRESDGNGMGHGVVIGWTGSHSTVQHLNSLRETLKKLRRRHDFCLRVIGAPDYHLEGVDTVAQRWRSDSEVQDLHRFDVGIMPVPDDDWSRGKCGMKLLQYMGAGVPAVGSALGANLEIIQDGVNGFLASTEDEWLEKLSRLIRDASLRRKMGLAGRRTVEERYSALRWAPRVGHILEQSAALKSAMTRGCGA